MPKPNHRPALVADRLRTALWFIGCLLMPWIGTALAAPSAAPSSAQRELQLEVWINGYPANTITPFAELPNGQLETARSELEELDLVVPGTADAGARVRLDQIAGLTYRYDAATQTLHLTVDARMRKAKVYEPKSDAVALEPAPAGYGLVVNYDLFASASQGLTSREQTGRFYGFSGLNATLDGRVTTPEGFLTQTAIVGNIPTYGSQAGNGIADAGLLRLDTAFSRVDPMSLMTYRAGDTINGGLAWTQPLRMAGVQIQHNFAARSDIVTSALPSFSGTAAAPSTVDVFVNGVRTYSQQVAAGPFTLANVPTIGSGGEARVVVRDASGKEVETAMPFYSSQRLLKPGMYEASAEGGVVRYNYAVRSNDYGSTPIGSASLRAGITDWLTGEVHLEGGAGLVNGGIGGATRVMDRAVVTAALSGSVYDGNAGVQLFGSLDTQIGPVSLHAQTSRSLGKYNDLAQVTTKLRPTTANEDARAALATGVTTFTTNYRPAINRDSVTVSMPIDFDHSTISATYLRTEVDTGSVTQTGLVTYARPLIGRATLFATAFADFNARNNLGIYVGTSIPLGDVTMTASFNKTNTATTGGVDASKPLGAEPGNWGWRVRDAEGDGAYRTAALSHRTEQARLEASVRQDDQRALETFEASGAIVATGQNVYLTNTIDDSYAVVSTGAPGVRVLSENRFVGETGEDGTLLVPGLRSNQKNRISIDQTGLSLNAEVEHGDEVVVPATKSGVAVDLKVKREGSSAIVVLKRADGKFVGVGSMVKIAGSSSTGVVGYDGQAFLKGLAAHNTVTVTGDAGTCQATFDFKPAIDTQVMIGPVECR